MPFLGWAIAYDFLFALLCFTVQVLIYSRLSESLGVSRLKVFSSYSFSISSLGNLRSTFIPFTVSFPIMHDVFDFSLSFFCTQSLFTFVHWMYRSQKEVFILPSKKRRMEKLKKKDIKKQRKHKMDFFSELKTRWFTFRGSHASGLRIYCIISLMLWCLCIRVWVHFSLGY